MNTLLKRGEWMYNSESGSFELANPAICQSCGSVTMSYEKTSYNKKRGLTYAVLGWLCTAISLLFMPILFGAVAVAMGFLTYSERSKTHGALLISIAFICLVLGSLVSFIVAGTMFI